MYISGEEITLNSSRRFYEVRGHKILDEPISVVVRFPDGYEEPVQLMTDTYKKHGRPNDPWMNTYYDRVFFETEVHGVKMRVMRDQFDRLEFEFIDIPIGSNE